MGLNDAAAGREAESRSAASVCVGAFFVLKNGSKIRGSLSGGIPSHCRDHQVDRVTGRVVFQFNEQLTAVRHGLPGVDQQVEHTLLYLVPLAMASGTSPTLFDADPILVEFGSSKSSVSSMIAARFVGSKEFERLRATPSTELVIFAAAGPRQNLSNALTRVSSSVAADRSWRSDDRHQHVVEPCVVVLTSSQGRSVSGLDQLLLQDLDLLKQVLRILVGMCRHDISREPDHALAGRLGFRGVKHSVLSASFARLPLSSGLSVLPNAYVLTRC